MSTLHFTPTLELARLLSTLGTDSNFEKLMGIMEARCTGLAVWAHSIPDETQRMWAGGRVQELADILKMYNNRHELLKQFTTG